MSWDNGPNKIETQAEVTRPVARRWWLLVAGAVVIVMGAIVAAWSARKHATAVESDEPPVTEVPVHVSRVRTMTVHRYVDGVGTVAPEPAHEDKPAASAQLSSQTTGVVARTLCAEGQRVEKGAPLFLLDARTAVADEQKAIATKALEQAKVARAVSALEFQERELERTKRLFKDNLATGKEVSEAEVAARTARDDLGSARASVEEASRAVDAIAARRSLLTITAPLSGTVVHVFVRAGEAVDVTTPATVLAEIVDLDRLVVEATVPAVELSSLKIGQPAELFVAERREGGNNAAAGASPSSAATGNGGVGRKYDGRLSFIGFQVDRKTDSVPVRLSFAPDLGLRPGQYLRVRIAVEERKDRLVVPISAVSAGREAGAVVSVVEGDRAIQRPVVVGLIEGEFAEIDGAGIHAGMTVVTAGAYGLPADTKVRILGEP